MPQTDETLITIDPVAEAGKQIATLNRAFNRTDRAANNRNNHRYRQTEPTLSAIQDTIEIMEAMICAREATTFEGAMAQVMVAMNEARNLSAAKNNKNSGDGDLNIRRIERCLYSVLNILSSKSDVGSTELGADYYMSPTYNPHKLIQKAMMA